MPQIVGDGDDWRLGELREADHTVLTMILRAARTIGSDAGVVPFVDQMRQFAYRLLAAVAAGAPHTDQVELAEHARQFLAVLAGADEHRDAVALPRVPVFPKEVRHQEDAVVPEREDAGSFRRLRQQPRQVIDAPAQRAANERNKNTQQP